MATERAGARHVAPSKVTITNRRGERRQKGATCRAPALLLGILLGCAASLHAQPTPLRGAAELQETLDRLNTLGSMMMLGAHPDDENTTVISYFARGRHIRSAYLSATRGEGGQNLIGTEQGALMGVIRTQELLEARRIDGGEQFFTRVIDYGFSKTPEEAIGKWGRDVLLADMVRAIRRFRPDVIVSRFPPKPGSGGHGQHTAVGHLGPEAYEAAGDASRFTEMGLEPWKARGYYYNFIQFGPPRRNQPPPPPDRITTELGDYDPVLGKSYGEIAGESRSMHRSQSMGTSQRKGSVTASFDHIAGEKAEGDIFDGIDTSWGRVSGGETVGKLLAQARDEYRPASAGAILPTLLEAYGELVQLDDPWADFKLGELTRAIELASGIWIDAVADRWDAAPGESLNVTLEVLSRSKPSIAWTGAEVSGTAMSKASGVGPLTYNRPARREVEVAIPSSADYSQPVWLRKPAASDGYQYVDESLIGDPESPNVLDARFDLKFGDVTVPITKPVVYRWVDRAYGERSRALQVVPPVAVSLAQSNLIFASQEPQAVPVRLLSNVARASGSLSLDIPAGWRAEPASIPVELSRKGQETTLEFKVYPPSDPSSGELTAKLNLGEKVLSTGMQAIEYDHISIQMTYPEATIPLHRVDVKLLSKNIGYIMGAGDKIPEALEQLGADVTLLSESDLASADLAGFDAIVVGVRALNTRPDLLAAKERVLGYVEEGGTLVMQYNTVSFRRRGGGGAPPPATLAPFPMTASRNRVTDEFAEMTLAIADHPLLQAPNRITAKDFDGWVQERGLYFMSEWDERYDSPLLCNDPGEDPQGGSLLYARHGKGVYIFTGLSWFRQLPAGVPGAYRLFANLVSAGAVSRGR